MMIRFLGDRENSIDSLIIASIPQGCRPCQKHTRYGYTDDFLGRTGLMHDELMSA